MKSRPFSSIIAVSLIASLIAPSALFLVPQKADAQVVTQEVPGGPTFLAQLKTGVETTITAIKSTLIEVHAYTSAAADYAQWTNTFILQPLAFVLSGNLMKMLTAGVIAFVIGKANGTGAPQFAVDVMRTMQTVSDSQALAYLNSFGRNSNSPFAYSISSALRTNYLQKTSLAGFWAANMNTLARSTPSYAPGFLNGNWSQGGVVAWFALTTRTENNPYMLYQTSESQMAALIGSGAGGATGARSAQLSWGQGFMSWCGANDTTTPADAQTQTFDDGSTLTTDSTGKTTATNAIGINPGDPCLNKDGTPGTIKTPGSVIKATLDKVLGGQQDQIVRMGNIGPQINQILGNVATVLQTVQFASQILGGPGSGGLFGVDQASGSNSTSRLIQYQATPSLGVTNSNVYQSAASSPISSSDMSNRITQYQSAWNTIGGAANAASTTVQSLISYCNAQVNDPNASPSAITTQVTAAQTALTTEIAPVLARVATAMANIAAATAMVTKVQSELNAGTDTAGSAYFADSQTLQTMPPTMSDVGNAMQDSQVFGTATAIPAGSLTVSANSLVDQMSLIATNAAALQSVCTPVAPTQTNSGGGD